MSEVKYKIQESTYQNIFTHLLECNTNFSPKLSDRVEIDSYANKIYKNSKTYEAWSEECLIGLLAIYLNEEECFITNVSVTTGFMGQGIASSLISMCISHESEKCSRLLLEVSNANIIAIDLYRRFGFIKVNTIKGLTTMELKIGESKNEE